MSLNDLAIILNKMYSNAPEGYRVAKVQLFGVKYAEYILRNNYKATRQRIAIQNNKLQKGV
jgi:hypothetical protein